RQSFPRKSSIGRRQPWSARTDRIRYNPAGLPRNIERQRGDRDFRADHSAARLRDELEGHHHDRRDAARHQQPALTLMIRTLITCAAVFAFVPHADAPVAGEAATILIGPSPPPGQKLALDPVFLTSVAKRSGVIIALPLDQPIWV